MAQRRPGRGRKGRRPAAPRVGRRRLRLLWGAAIVAVTVFLYYRPISSYLETRNDLAVRQAEVNMLRQARTTLRLRLANSTSVEATEREARRLGFVRPGEQLFVVRGVSAWRRAHGSSRESAP